MRRLPLFFLCWYCCVGCGSLRPAQEAIEREIRILDLLEIKPETPTDSASCIRLYTLNSPDRYIYRRIADFPPGTIRYEYDVPSDLLPNISTRGLLETGLGHPLNSQLSPAPVCWSIWRCRESMFELRNVWREFEQRPDALEECLKRYDTLNIHCDIVFRTLDFSFGANWEVLTQTCLIEVILTRPKLLEQLSQRAKQKLTAKVLAKHKLKDKFYDGELGKTQGLWLLCVLMLEAGDTTFTELVKLDKEIEWISQGLTLGHSLRMKAVVVAHAERFITAK